jgi:glycosyltransferase involved in cell wall biosynthesis
MRIAWFTPFNPLSAIGHYSEAIILELARQDEVVVFASDVGPTTPPRRCAVETIPVGDGPYHALLRHLEGFDAVVYNMGNHAPYHKRVFEVLSGRAGIVVLHDLVMRDFFRGYFIQEKQTGLALLRQQAGDSNPELEMLNHACLLGQHSDAPDDPNWLRVPLFGPALHRCLGVVVHSEYSRVRVAETTAAPVEKIDFPLFGPVAAFSQLPPRPPRGDRVRLLTFGMLNSNKLVHAVLETIAGNNFLRGRVEYTVIGNCETKYQARLRELIDKHRLQDCVHLLGWRCDQELRQELLRADVVLNLRNPHSGESSASLLDALLAGVATVVWNHGYFAEFPDDSVCKVASQDELAGVLERLCSDVGLRQSLGDNARRHALTRFNTASFCQKFRDFVAVTRSAQPVLGLVDVLSDRLLEFGLLPPEGLPEKLAAKVAALAGGSPSQRAEAA